MPRVPNYQPNQIGPVRANEERLRAVDNGGGVFGAIGQGLGQLAGQASQRMVDLDERDAKNDDTQARQIAADKGLALSNTLAQYKATEAGAARAGQQGFNTQTQEIWDNALKEATTPRMRGFVQQRLEGVYRSAQEQGFAHALQGAKVERSMAFDATGASWSQQALNTDSEEERDNFIASGVQSVLDKAREIDGIDLGATPEIANQRALAYTSGVHQGMADKVFAQPVVDVPGATAYFEKYKDQMTPAVQAGWLDRLKTPLRARLYNDRADQVQVELGELTAANPSSPDAGGQAGGVGDYMARVRAGESGGNDSARNPRSSATGRYQFTNSTWLSYFKKRYGDSKLSDAQILAKRGDGQLQDQLMGDLTGDNSKALSDAGLPVNGASLYLAHFAGAAGAKSVLKADENTPVSQILGREVIASNPHLARMDAGDLIAWAGSVGGGSRAAYVNAPRERDRSDVYAAIQKVAEREHWPLEVTEGVTAVWEKRMSTDEGLLRDQYASAETEFEQFVAKQPGGAIERWGQVPAKIASRLDPKFAAKQQQDISQREAKDREEALAAAQLQQGILAGVVDPADADVKKAGDALYVRELTSKRGLKPDQKMAFDVAFAAKVGFVPPALKGQLIGQLRSTNPQQQAYAASVIAEMGKRNSAIINDFSDEQIARAQQLTSYQEQGFSPQDASQRMSDMERVPQSDRAARKSLFPEASKKAGEPADLIEDTFGQKPSPTMLGRFNSIWQSEFERTGDIDVARSTATATLRKEWSVSKVNGSSQLMRFAPERYYGVGDKGEQDAKWIREQAAHDLLANGMSEPNAEQRLKLLPYGTMNGQPVYIGTLQQPDGTIVTLSDVNGRPKKWRPDFKTSEEAKRQQRRRDDLVKSARSDRTQGRATSPSASLLRMLPNGNKM